MYLQNAKPLRKHEKVTAWAAPKTCFVEYLSVTSVDFWATCEMHASIMIPFHKHEENLLEVDLYQFFDGS